MVSLFDLVGDNGLFRTLNERLEVQVTMSDIAVERLVVELVELVGVTVDHGVVVGAGLMPMSVGMSVVLRGEVVRRSLAMVNVSDALIVRLNDLMRLPRVHLRSGHVLDVMAVLDNGAVIAMFVVAVRLHVLVLD